MFATHSHVDTKEMMTFLALIEENEAEESGDDAWVILRSKKKNQTHLQLWQIATTFNRRRRRRRQQQKQKGEIIYTNALASHSFIDCACWALQVHSHSNFKWLSVCVRSGVKWQCSTFLLTQQRRFVSSVYNLRAFLWIENEIEATMSAHSRRYKFLQTISKEQTNRRGRGDAGGRGGTKFD